MKEEFIRLAQQVYGTKYTEQDLHFAALVAAAEREECANLCEELMTCETCPGPNYADAIRARSQ